MKRNRWMAFGGAALLVAGLTGGMWAMTRAEEEDCDAAVAEIEAVWNAEKKAAVVAAFGEALPDGAEDPVEAVTGGLDTYVSAWSTRRRDTCQRRNTAPRDERSSVELAAVCLERRRHALSALVGVLADADENVAKRGKRLVERARGPETCDDEEALRREVPLPSDPDVLARVLRLEAQLTTIRALGYAFREREALDTLEAMLPELESIGHEPLVIRALDRKHVLENKIGETAAALETAREVFDRAVVAGQPRQAASASALVAFLLSSDPAQAGSAEPWAVAALAHARATSDLEVLAVVHNNVFRALPESEQAAHLDESIRVHEEAYGPGSPKVLNTMFNAHVVAREERRLDDAEGYLNRALEVARAQGEDSIPVATVKANLGNLAESRGDFEAQERNQREAMAIYEAKYGPDSHRLCSFLGTLGRAAMARSDWPEALRLGQRCLANADGSLVPDHRDLVNSRLVVARAATHLGRLDEAREALEVILNGPRLKQDPKLVVGIVARIGLARVELASGRFEAVHELISVARDLAADIGELDATAYVDGQWAMILWDLPERAGGDRTRARELAADVVSRCGGTCDLGDLQLLRRQMAERGIDLPDESEGGPEGKGAE